MRKKKNLWSGVSILIVAVLVITAFIRGNAQAWLLAAAFVIWAVWATYYFLVPYIKEELHKREAKRIRKKCEKQDAAFDRFIIPEVSDPVEQVLLRHANYRISAYLQSVYPNATWEWREEFPERIIAKGGTGRVKLFGVDGYNFADVTFDQNGGNVAVADIVNTDSFYACFFCASVHFSVQIAFCNWKHSVLQPHIVKHFQIILHFITKEFRQLNCAVTFLCFRRSYNISAIQVLK